MNRKAAVFLVTLLFVMVPLSQAKAVDLGLQTWDDYYPFTMQFSFVQAAGVADNFTARGGSTAAYALHTLSYALFSANATDIYNYTLDIKYQVPISQFILVTVVSSDKIKTFTIPVYNETDVHIGYIFTLEQQPVIPTPEQLSAIAVQSVKSYLDQYTNVIGQSLDTQNSNINTLALVAILDFIAVVILGAAVIRMWRSKAQ